jgi:Heparinase II/III-like protein/Heparinase II/III N-terminus
VSRPDPGWYLRRVRRMTPSEVGHRAREAGLRRAWVRRQVHPGDAFPPPSAHAVRTFPVVLPDGARAAVPPDAASAVVAAADRVLAGEWAVLGTPRPDSAAPDWFLDPATGRRAPSDRLAFAVHHRDEDETGNVKLVWELSRHHHVTVLAAAWWLTGDERYAQAAAAQLRSWWRANPLLSGVHWTSGIELGVRLLAWVWVRRLLDGWPAAADLFEHDDDAVRQIAWHQEYLAAFVSRGSSANNHVLAEAAGQLAAACAFDWFERSDRWRRDAAERLEGALAANTLPSGVNAELATDYHRFVLELVLVAGVEARAAGHDLGAATWQRLATSLDAGLALLDDAGRPPRQGDGDEGRGLVVDDPDRDPWAVALGAATAVLGAPAWAPDLPGSVQATILAALAGRPCDHAPQRPRRFADAGVVLLRSRPEDGAQLWCRCDGGPHGFGPIAAHAHADALSVEVRHDGVDLLADPGTYCYHGEPRWRQYFRSTLGHNTLELGGTDSAVPGGPFLWMTRPRTTPLSCTVGDGAVQTWSAEHDGYRRRLGAVHRRTVTLDSAARTLTVVDTVRTEHPAPARLAWHLGPAVAVELDGPAAVLRWSAAGTSRTARLRLPGVLVWTAHRGEEDPPLGWYSPGFARKVPSTSLVGRGAVAAGVTLTTTLTVT